MQTTAPTDRFLVHITDVAIGQTDTYALTGEQLTWVFGPEMTAKLQAVHADRGQARLRTRRLWAYRRRGLARQLHRLRHLRRTTNRFGASGPPFGACQQGGSQPPSRPWPEGEQP